MNVLQITEACMARGMMTMQKAIALRSSVHVFVGAFGDTSLFEAEFNQWVTEQCSECKHRNTCPVNTQK